MHVTRKDLKPGDIVLVANKHAGVNLYEVCHIQPADGFVYPHAWIQAKCFFGPNKHSHKTYWIRPKIITEVFKR